MGWDGSQMLTCLHLQMTICFSVSLIHTLHPANLMFLTLRKDLLCSNKTFCSQKKGLHSFPPLCSAREDIWKELPSTFFDWCYL